MSSAAVRRIAVSPTWVGRPTSSAGSRAIGVGYPEKANLAFDANDVRLAMIWQGAFIDAARHRTGRGVGFEKPLGGNVVKLPAGPEFAHLSMGMSGDFELAIAHGATTVRVGQAIFGDRLDPNDYWPG